MEQIRQDCLEYFQEEMKTAMTKIVEIQDKTIMMYTEQCRIEMEEGDNTSRMVTNSSNSPKPVLLRMDSLIVLPEQKSELYFIAESLNKPSSLELMFRASEH
jgi:hypothetical protein